MDKWNELKKWIDEEVVKLHQEFDELADESSLSIARGMDRVLLKMNDMERQ